MDDGRGGDGGVNRAEERGEPPVVVSEIRTTERLDVNREWKRLQPCVGLEAPDTGDRGLLVQAGPEGADRVCDGADRPRVAKDVAQPEGDVPEAAEGHEVNRRPIDHRVAGPEERLGMFSGGDREVMGGRGSAEDSPFVDEARQTDALDDLDVVRHLPLFDNIDQFTSGAEEEAFRPRRVAVASRVANSSLEFWGLHYGRHRGAFGTGRDEVDAIRGEVRVAVLLDGAGPPPPRPALWQNRRGRKRGLALRLVARSRRTNIRA